MIGVAKGKQNQLLEDSARFSIALSSNLTITPASTEFDSISWKSEDAREDQRLRISGTINLYDGVLADNTLYGGSCITYMTSNNSIVFQNGEGASSHFHQRAMMVVSEET